MRTRISALVVAMLALGICGQTFAQDNQPPAGDQQDRPRRGGGPGGPGGPGGMFGQDPLRELLAALGDLNLSPDFTLTAEQKTKIQTIRDDFKAQTEKWRKDHEADLKKIQDQFTELRRNAGGGGNAAAGGGDAAGGGGGRPDFQKMQDLNKQRQDLQATAPKSDDFAKQILAVLNEEQTKKLEEKRKERREEQEKQRQEMMQRFGGGPGGAGGPGGQGGGRGFGRGGQGGGGDANGGGRGGQGGGRGGRGGGGGGGGGGGARGGGGGAN